MHAVTFAQPGDPDVLTWAEVDDPVAGPGEVIIEVTAAGVNRADLMQRRGQYPPPPGASEILGLECSGTIAELGDGVTGWTVGDPCVALLAGGGYATRVAVPAGQVVPRPDGVDAETAGGLIEVAATVVANFDLAGLPDRSSATVLVHGGAGGIGSFAIQYAARLGATVLTTAGSEEKLAYCRDLGADAAIDYHADWVEAVRSATDGAGVDVILDVMGASYLGPNVDVLARDGRLMIIGLQGGRSATIDLGALLSKRGAVFCTALRSRPTEAKAVICSRVRDVVWPMISSGDVRPTRHQSFSMSRAAEAHARLESGDNIGKIILLPD